MITDSHPLAHLSRELFLRELVEGLAAVLNSAVGADIAASCLSDIGLAVGVRVDRDFKAATGLQRPLTLDEYRTLVEEVLANLYLDGQIVETGPDCLHIQVQGERTRLTLFSSSQFREIGTSIFGATASVNFGYGKVHASVNTQDGRLVQLITIFTADTPESRASPGEEYYPEIVSAFSNVQTQLKVVAENRILREQLQESAVEYRDRNKQISALAAISSIVSQSLDPEEILASALKMLLDAIGVEAGAIFQIDENTGGMVLAHHCGMDPDVARQILYDQALPPEARVPQPRWEPILGDRRHSPPDWRFADFQCYALGPMRSKVRPIGVILVLARLRRAFSPLEMELLELVANEVGVGLENIRFHDYLARQVKRLNDLREISAHLNSCNRLDEVLDQAAESVTRKLGFDRVGIFLVDEEQNCLVRMRGTDEYGALIHTEQLRIPLRHESGTLARAVLEKQPLHVLSAKQEADLNLPPEEAAGLAHHHISAFARVPLIAEGNVVGAISVDNMLHRRPINDEELNMLMIFGHHVAIAIGNARFTEALHRSAEQLQRVDSLRSQFVSMISHELRSPLHRIRNAGGLILDPETDAEQRERFARMIIRSSDYLTAIVNNLLTESRIEQGSLRVEPRPVFLAGMVRDLVQELRAASLPSEQELTLEIPGDLCLLADPPYLKLILANLLSNASKASARNGRIEVRAVSVGRYARICVRDFGVGIPADRLETIFDRYISFGREDSTQASSGVGLGLHICRNLVEAHGGRLWVTSQVGQGSEFCFTLPVPAGDNVTDG